MFVSERDAVKRERPESGWPLSGLTRSAKGITPRLDDAGSSEGSLEAGA